MDQVVLRLGAEMTRIFMGAVCEAFNYFCKVKLMGVLKLVADLF